MVVIETSVFTRQVRRLLSEAGYHRLQVELALRPDLGDLIPGGGGLRKVRWARRGQGKRGGVRVIYYWAVAREQLLLLFVYGKNVRDDLTPAQLRTLRRIVEDEYP